MGNTTSTMGCCMPSDPQEECTTPRKNFGHLKSRLAILSTGPHSLHTPRNVNTLLQESRLRSVDVEHDFDSEPTSSSRIVTETQSPHLQWCRETLQEDTDKETGDPVHSRSGPLSHRALSESAMPPRSSREIPRCTIPQEQRSHDLASEVSPRPEDRVAGYAQSGLLRAEVSKLQAELAMLHHDLALYAQRRPQTLPCSKTIKATDMRTAC